MGTVGEGPVDGTRVFRGRNSKHTRRQVVWHELQGMREVLPDREERKDFLDTCYEAVTACHINSRRY